MLFCAPYPLRDRRRIQERGQSGRHFAGHLVVGAPEFLILGLVGEGIAPQEVQYVLSTFRSFRQPSWHVARSLLQSFYSIAAFGMCQGLLREKISRNYI